MFSDLHPAAHLFITPGGKIWRCSTLALVSPGDLKDQRGMLVLTSVELWEQYISVISSNTREFKILAMLEKSDIVECGSVKFDSLIFVKGKHIKDLPLEEWFLLIEKKKFGDMNLLKYFQTEIVIDSPQKTFNH